MRQYHDIMCLLLTHTVKRHSYLHCFIRFQRKKGIRPPAILIKDAIVFNVVEFDIKKYGQATIW